MRWLIALAGAGAMLLAACGADQHGDLKQELAQMTKDLRGRVDPLPQVKPYEPVPYKGEGEVDPFRPERINVEVLNGSGIAGEASRVARELTAAGFNVVSVGNADRSDYATSEVRHDPAYDESGRTLGAAVTGSTVLEDLSLGSTLVVVVGADRPSVSQVQVSGASPSPTEQEELDVRTADEDICSTD